jgi:hypothetical protein
MSNDKLKSFIAKFRKSEQFAAKVAVDCFQNEGKGVAYFNRKRLSAGEDAEGKDLGEYGVWRTEQREERGLQTEFIDLKFEGKFHESIYTEGKLLSAKTPAVVFKTTSPEDWAAIQEDNRFKDALGLNQEDRNKVGMMVALEIRNKLLQYYT